MLVPALVFKEELLKTNALHWYDNNNQYMFGLINRTMCIDDNEECHRQFVSVDNDKVIGYICYHTDWVARSICDFGIVCYDKHNPVFIEDLFTALYQIFIKEKWNRFEWCCHSTNPTIRNYRKFIARIGGEEIGTLHEVISYADGTKSDLVLFEVMQKNFNEENFMRIYKKVIRR